MHRMVLVTAGVAVVVVVTGIILARRVQSEDKDDERRSTGEFGLPLQQVPVSQTTDGTEQRVTRIVARCVREVRERALKEVGVFRIAGNHERVLELCTIPSDQWDLSKESTPTVCSLLKRFFSQLPQALLPHDEVIALANVATDSEVAEAHKLLMSLDERERAALVCLSRLCADIDANREDNLMPLSSLAKIWSGSLIREPEGTDPVTQMSNVTVAARGIQRLLRVAATVDWTDSTD
ncbi:MAG: hypothetical protein MHM6MM_001716 [Cercozoa sp. M6MM]